MLLLLTEESGCLHASKPSEKCALKTRKSKAKLLSYLPSEQILIFVETYCRVVTFVYRDELALSASQTICLTRKFKFP